MKIQWGAVFALVCLFNFAFCLTNDEETFDHSNWQYILNKYLHLNQTVNKVNETVFDYEGLSRNMDVEFSNYLNQLATISNLDDYSENEQLAILINAYNIFSVNMIIQHPTKTHMGKFTWPIKSIRDISGFFVSVWDLEAGTVAGTSYTLNALQQKIADMSDTRIYACIAPAAVSSPDLQFFAYNGTNIDFQKNYSMVEFLNNTGKGLELDTQNNKLYLSALFLWQVTDFSEDSCTCLNNGQVLLLSFHKYINFLLSYFYFLM